MATAPQTSAMPILCTATGTKFFAPAMTAADVCARFVRVLGPLSIRDRLIVELRFVPRGLASAKATRFSAGRPQHLPVYELAISDRQFAVTDIDSLARDLARAMTSNTPRKGKG